jgi:hypothetical protein
MTIQQKPLGTFFDVLTGESIERELTDEEIASLPHCDQLPSAE